MWRPRPHRIDRVRRVMIIAAIILVGSVTILLAYYKILFVAIASGRNIAELSDSGAKSSDDLCD